MIKLKKLLKEVEKGPYEYGCVMLYFEFDLQPFTSFIPNEDLFDDGSGKYGIETEPHVTLLYGLHSNVKPQIIQQILDKIRFGDILLQNMSAFVNSDYEVLKFDAIGEGLFEANSILKKLPNSSEYDEYNPHMTIAYLQKGSWAKIANKFKSYSHEVTPLFAIYSLPSGKKFKLKIK